MSGVKGAPVKRTQQHRSKLLSVKTRGVIKCCRYYFIFRTTPAVIGHFRGPFGFTVRHALFKVLVIMKY